MALPKPTQYFPTLFICICASLSFFAVAHLASAASRIPQGIALGAAMLPLAYYHMGFLARRSWSDSSAIDSVYYYGFLLTVAALAASALGVATGRAETDDVLFNFGLGIFATGYAVVARMHLLSRVPVVDSEEAATAAMSSYIAKTGDLVSDVEMIAHRLRSFADTVLNESVSAHSTAVARMQEAVTASTKVFEARLNDSLRAVQQATEQIRDLVSDPAFAAERTAFAKSLSHATRATKAFETAVVNSTSHAQAGGEAQQKAAAAFSEASTHLGRLSAAIGELAGDNGPLITASRNAEASADATARAITRTSTSVASLSALSEQIGSASGALAQLRTFAEGTSKHLCEIVAASERLGAAVRAIDMTSASLTALSSSIGSGDHALPTLATDLRQLSQDLAGLRVAVSQTASNLEADVTRSAKASSMLTESLVSVAQTIVDRTNQRTVS